MALGLLSSNPEHIPTVFTSFITVFVVHTNPAVGLKQLASTDAVPATLVSLLFLVQVSRAEIVTYVTSVIAPPKRSPTRNSTPQREQKLRPK